jgi:hypothetical protein
MSYVALLQGVSGGSDKGREWLKEKSTSIGTELENRELRRRDREKETEKRNSITASSINVASSRHKPHPPSLKYENVVSNKLVK